MTKETLEETVELNKQIADIIIKANIKNIAWAKKYWRFKFKTADLFEEAEQELLDMINYTSLQIIKMREIKLALKENENET